MRRLTILRVLLLALLVIAALPSVAQPSQAGDPPADLVFENRKIVTLRASLGSITPRRRAAAAKARLEAVRI